MFAEILNLPEAKVTIKMKCKSCGHIQTVKGNRLNGEYYFGSSYNWCDSCDKDLPIPIEEPKEYKKMYIVGFPVIFV